MLRASLLAPFVLVLLVGCRISDREGLNPIPDSGPPLSYAEMLARTRGQAGAALDAFYVDAWLDLEQAAQRLEQSARLLPKATQIPEALHAKIEAQAELLRQDAVKLGEAARAKSALQANEVMQRINQRVRQLNAPDQPPPGVLPDKK